MIDFLSGCFSSMNNSGLWLVTPSAYSVTPFSRRGLLPVFVKLLFGRKSFQKMKERCRTFYLRQQCKHPCPTIKTALSVNKCMFVYMYVFTYVCRYICMYVCKQTNKQTQQVSVYKCRCVCLYIF